MAHQFDGMTDIEHSHGINDPGLTHGAISAEEARIVKIARSLCEGKGFDPDRFVIADPVPEIGPKGHIMATRMCMSWELFLEDAIFAIRVVEDTDK